MRKTCEILGCLAAAVAILGGCASSGATHAYARTYDGVSPSLVTPDPVLHTLAGPRLAQIGWEYGRNDPAWRPPALSLGIAEIRHRETLRTTNARPREHTTTRSRSIRWILDP